MDRIRRQDVILDKLRDRGRVWVTELSRELAASVATIRRDLHDLEAQQLVRCVHGGAELWPTTRELPLPHKALRHLAEKRRIAAEAVRHLGDATAVGLTGGTTTVEVARLVGQSHGPLTVFTTALNIAWELANFPRIRCIIAGGEVSAVSMEVTGNPAEELAARYNLDVLFAGVDGLTPAAGGTGYDLFGTRVDRIMIERAAKVIILADSTKLGLVQPTQICATEQIDVLITDAAADPAIVEGFRAKGVDVKLV